MDKITDLGGINVIGLASKMRIGSRGVREGLFAQLSKSIQGEGKDFLRV